MTGLFFELRPGVLEPHGLTAGPHDPNLIAGGAIVGAALSIMERQALVPGRVGRVTADFLRPAPIETLTIVTRPIRQGRRVSLTEATARSRGYDVAIVSALRLATDVSEPVEETARWPIVEDLPDPAALDPIVAWHDGFFGGAIECRTRGGHQGIGAGWCIARLCVPIIEGETPSTIAAAAALADVAHGVGTPVDQWPPRAAPVNPDLTTSFVRDPQAGWIHLDVAEQWPGDGTGLAKTRLTDRAGLFGVALQTQVLTPLGATS